MQEIITTASIYAAARQQVDGLADQIAAIRIEQAGLAGQREALIERLKALDASEASAETRMASTLEAQAIALETLHAAERALATGEA